MRRWRGRTLTVLWILVAGATGCDIPLAPQAATLSASPSPSTPAASPTSGATPTPTPRPTPTGSASPSPTPSPTTSPTLEPTPTPTPAATPTPTPPGTLILGTSPEAKGAWTSATAMARPRMGLVVVTLDNRLVVSGGFPTEVLEGFQPASDSWAEQDLSASFLTAKVMVYPGQYFSCGGTVGTNRFVVAGGSDGSGEIYRPRVYTLDEGFQYTVSFGAYIPTPRYAVAGATIGNKLYVAGGSRNRSVTQGAVSHTISTENQLDAYDVPSDTWKTMASMPTAVSGAASVALNGRLYVLGGLQANGVPTSEVQVYRPDLNQWVSVPGDGAIPSMRIARHSEAATVLDGKIYVLGGVTEDQTVTTAAEVYDPVTQTWQALPPLPFARSLHAAAAFGGKVYVLGGNDAQGRPQRTVEAYTP